MDRHDESNTEIDLPAYFILGTSTAATQIEGGGGSDSWRAWAASGKTKDGGTPDPACDHWNRVGEDTDLLRRLGVGGHRFGLEWCRLEPEPGRFDAVAVAHYRAELTSLRDAGIEPLVTLHHFTNPLWFERHGGFLAKDAPEVFDRYVKNVAEALGDLVDYWITINEPSVYLYHGYVAGIWPPGRLGDLGAYFRGARRMIRAHRLAYSRLREVAARHGRPVPRVGVAHHLRIFDPYHRGFRGRLESLIASAYGRLHQDIFLRGMTGSPKGRPGIGRFADFLGVNYYTRDLVKLVADPSLLFGRLCLSPGASTNDLGWEIYPAGLSRICRRLHARYGLPIVITENGLADARDRLRSTFIVEHLSEVSKLIAEGVDVRGYYHWTLMDNFEWAEGYTAKFGLFEVDFATQTRRLRPSGRLYEEICRGSRT